MNRQLKVAALTILGALSLTASATITDGRSYGDWKGTCKENVCGVVQVQNNAQGEPVGRVLLRRLPQNDNVLVAFITLPLGVNLRAGLAIAIDNKEVGVMPFDFCEPGGCNAAVPLDDKTISKLKAGSNMQVAAFVGDEQQTLQFSLKGVTDSINNL